MEKSPTVSIVILNWNNYSDTKECIDSIQNQRYGDVNSILVDNGSDDDSYKKLMDQFDIQGIKLSDNTGFPAGNNIGIRAALDRGSDYVLLLNNDTILPTEYIIGDLIKSAESRSNLGILSPLITHYPNVNKIWFAKGGINSITGENKHKYRGMNLDELKLPNLVENDRVSGCAMLVPAEVFSKVGLLDPDYFLLESDTEFSLRVKEAGYKLITDTSQTIYHKVSASSGPKFSLSYYSSRNRWKLINEISEFHTTAKIFFFFGLMRATYRRIHADNSGHIGDLLHGVWDGLRGNWGEKELHGR